MKAGHKRKKSGKKADVAGVKAKISEVLESKKNLNQLLDLVEILDFDSEEDSEKVLLAAIKGLIDIFRHQIQTGDLKPFTADEDAKEDEDEEIVFKGKDDKKTNPAVKWLNERFEETVEKLTNLTLNENEAVFEAAFTALFNLFKALGDARPDRHKGKWHRDEKQRLINVVKSLCTRERDLKKQIYKFADYLELADVRDITLRSMVVYVKKTDKEKIGKLQIGNILSFLEKIKLKKLKQKDKAAVDFSSLLCNGEQKDGDEDSKSQYEFDFEFTRKSYSELWERFLKLKLDAESYKRALINLDEKTIALMTRPLLLTDFLVSSYSVGGSVSVLALGGLFTLMQKYNLEYPDFYTKLYALFFDPEMLHAKYRARFFYMADLFLTSTHLPEYLVAAFVKRSARLALQAPANVILFLFPFIGNLLMRHKGLAKMIHGRADDGSIINPETDPFDADQVDPAQCKAIDSCLWEIQSLQDHALPQVSKAAKFISKKLPEMEWNLGDYLEKTMEEMMNEESKKKVFVNVPLTFERPLPGMKLPKDDVTSSYFKL